MEVDKNCKACFGRITHTHKAKHTEEERMQPKMVVTDVDDCIIPTDGMTSGRFYEGLADFACAVLHANAGAFTPIGLCTGRDRNYVEAIAFVTGLPRFWCVIESGIALFNPYTKEMLLNPALTPKVRTAFEEIRRTRVPRLLESFPQLFDYPGNIINIALERRHGVDTPIDVYYQAVRDALQDLEQQGLLVVHHSRIAVDISPVGQDGTPIDKGCGVRFLAHKTGIDLSCMLGIGDSRGDFPTFKAVGMVGCPSNASPECKELVRERGRSE